MAIRYLSGINVDSNTLFVDDSNNRVGIGTASPSDILAINSSTTETILHLTNTSTGTAISDGLRMGLVGASAYFLLRENANMVFSTNNTERMRINNAGNVGIGTTSPTAPLTFGKSVYGAESSENYFRIKFQDQGGTHNDVGIGQPASGALGFNITAGNYFSFNNGTSGEIARLNGTGLGIGTTSPNEKLTIVNGNISLSDSYSIKWGNNYLTGLDSVDALRLFTAGAERVRVDNVGNVGIGTTSPQGILHVSAAKPTYTDSAIVFWGGTTNNNAHAGIVLTSAGDALTGTVGSNYKIDGTTTSQTNTNRSTGYITFSNTTTASKTSSVNIAGWAKGTTTEISRLFIDNDGNVGIGTTSPSSKLDVVSTASNLTNNIKFGDGTKGYLASGSSGVYLSDNNSSSAIMFTHGTRNVGIGTTSPNTKLHLEDSTAFITVRGNDASYSNAAIQLISGNATNNRALGVFHYVENSDVEWFAGLPYSGNDAYVINRNTGYTVPSSQSSPPGIGASGTRLFTINSSGNVGIGTASPADKLDVAGNISIGTSYKIYTGSASNSAGLDFGGSYFKASGYNGIIFYSSAAGVGSQSERMRITNAGSVGIGTTSPSAKLDVNGGGNFSGGIVTSGIDSAYTGVAIPKGAYLKSNDGSYLRNIIGHNSSGNIEIGQGGTSLISDIQLKPGTSGNITFYSSGSEDMRINSSGNVGIGTTSPSYKLDVVANSNDGIRLAANNALIGGGATGGDAQLIYWNGSIAYYGRNSLGGSVSQHEFRTGGITRLIVDASGNVGIGTTSPTYPLDVNGDGRITGMTFTASGAARRISTHSAAGLLQLNGGTSSSDGAFINIAGDSYGTGDYVEIYAAKTYVSGNVGIATTNPQALLQVGSVTTSVYSLATGNADIIAENKNLSDTQMGTLNVTSTTKTSSGTFNQGYGPSITFTQNGSGYVDGYEKVIGGIKTEIKNAQNLNFASIMQFYTHNNTSLSPRMTIDGGNVGIGTASPADKLSVQDGTITSTDSSGTNYAKLDRFSGLTLKGNGAGSRGVQTPNTDALTFGTNATERVRITSAGNVGIGTTSPTSSKLNVNSNGSSDSVIRIDGANARGASRYALQIVDSDTNGRGSVYVSTTSGPSATFVGGDYVAHSKSTDTFIAIAGRVNSYPSPSANASSIVTTMDGGSYPFNSYGHLVISSRHDASRDILFRTNNTDRVVIQGGGNVGIGTTSPSAQLHVYSTGNGEIEVQRASGALFNIQAQSALATIGTDSNHPLYLKTNAGTRVAITTSGNVGIGTTTPTTRLDLGAGNGAANGLSFGSSLTGVHRSSDGTTLDMGHWGNVAVIIDTDNNDSSRHFSVMANSNDSTTATTLMRVLETGNVGINTTSPSAKLHVNGSLRVDDASNFANVGASLNADPGNGILGNDPDGLGNDQNILGTPDTWLAVNINGTDYVIPAYAP